MKRPAAIAVALSTVALTLGACASGGGGGATSPPPPISPPPSSPPSPPPPPTSFLDLRSDHTFRAGSSTYREAGAEGVALEGHEFHSPAGTHTVIYDADTGSFTISIREGATTPYYEQTFGPDDVVEADSTDFVTVYERDGDRLTLTNPSDPELGLQYVASAGWVSDDDIDVLEQIYTNNRGFAVFGFETEFGQMPNSGSARYDLRVVGILIDPSGEFALDGDGELTVDFASGLIDTTMTIERLDEAGARSPWGSLAGAAFIIAAPTGEGGSNLFAGAVRRGDATFHFSGAFFGPRAQEVGGAFAYSDLDESEFAIASFLGSTPGENTPASGYNASLSDLQVSQIFFARSAQLAFHNTHADGVHPNVGRSSEPEIVAYDAATDTFTVPVGQDQAATDLLDVLGVALLTPPLVDTSMSDPGKTVYAFDGDRYTLFAPGASPYALRYAAIGAWENADLDPAIDLAFTNGAPLRQYTVYGLRTPDRPLSGGATYDVNAVGSHMAGDVVSPLIGTGTIVARFDSSFWDIDLDFSLLNDAGVATPWRSFERSRGVAFGTSWMGQDGLNFFVFIEDVDGAGLEGTLEGSVYGPHAEEIGAVFTITESSASPDPTTEAAVGALVGAARP